MTDQPDEKGVEMPQLKWPLEDNLDPLYANHFSITRTNHEIVILFGEFIPTGFPRRSQEEIRMYLKEATIKPHSKIIVSKAGFKAFFRLLEDHFHQIEAEEAGQND